MLRYTLPTRFYIQKFLFSSSASTASGYLGAPAIKSTNPFSPDIRTEGPYVTQSPLQPQQLQSATVTNSPTLQQKPSSDAAKGSFWNGTGDKLTPLFDLTNFSW